LRRQKPSNNEVVAPDDEVEDSLNYHMSTIQHVLQTGSLLLDNAAVVCYKVFYVYNLLTLHV